MKRPIKIVFQGQCVDHAMQVHNLRWRRCLEASELGSRSLELPAGPGEVRALRSADRGNGKESACAPHVQVK